MSTTDGESRIRTEVRVIEPPTANALGAFVLERAGRDRLMYVVVPAGGDSDQTQTLWLLIDQIFPKSGHNSLLVKGRIAGPDKPDDERMKLLTDDHSLARISIDTYTMGGHEPGLISYVTDERPLWLVSAPSADSASPTA